jgi:hypothetical protein
MIEVLYDHQPWPIGFPEEIVVPGRSLVSYTPDGRQLSRWEITTSAAARLLLGVDADTVIWEIQTPATGRTTRRWWLWHQIVSECMSRGWTLASIPPPEARP